MQDSKTTTTEGRLLAIAAGMVFCAGTLGILFEDVIHGAPLALKHGLTLVTLAGTIMTGHLANGARASRHWFSAVGFALVFVCGTALVVYSSVGRQAASSIQTTGQIEEANERRADIKRARVKAQGMLETAQGDFARECKSGKGSRCDGIRATIDVYQAAVKGHNAELDEIGASKPVNPEAEQFAEIAAVVLGANKAKVKAGALLVVPFLVTLFLEFGAIVSLGYGLRRSYRQVKVPPPSIIKPEAFEPMPRGGQAVATKSEALQDLQALLRRGTPVSSQDMLVERWGCSKSTASKWTSEWEAEGLISRTQIGKFKMIEAA